ncbi:MAG: FMN-binding protein [Dermatophilaceae bacterium]
MRRIVIWALSTLTVLVLLFSYRTSTSSIVGASDQVVAPTRAASGGQAAPKTPPVPATPGAARVPGQPATPATPAPPAGGSTFVGAAVGTRYGNVQVQITVADGRITSATVLQVPNRDRKDVMINSRAVPILNQAVVAAQSADIDMVSGATVTSMAYVQSLQSALDQAHL